MTELATTGQCTEPNPFSVRESVSSDTESTRSKHDDLHDADNVLLSSSTHDNVRLILVNHFRLKKNSKNTRVGKSCNARQHKFCGNCCFSIILLCSIGIGGLIGYLIGFGLASSIHSKNLMNNINHNDNTATIGHHELFVNTANSSKNLTTTDAVSNAYQFGESIKIKLNKLYSIVTNVSYNYSQLSDVFCKPSDGIIAIEMLHPTECMPLCKKTYSKPDLFDLSKKIESKYRFQL